MKRSPSLLACGLALAALATPVLARDDDGSLEAFLRRVREAREAEQARLQPMVEELVRKLGQARSANDIKKLHTDLEALGSETAPLLVPYLDPGATPTTEQERQAQEVAVILARSRDPALLEDLVRLAQLGSPRGRLLAVRV